MSKNDLTIKENTRISPEIEQEKSHVTTNAHSINERINSRHERIIQQMEDLDLLTETKVIFIFNLLSIDKIISLQKSINYFYNSSGRKYIVIKAKKLSI